MIGSYIQPYKTLKETQGTPKLHQLKAEKLAEKEDALYSVAAKVSQLKTQVKAKEEEVYGLGEKYDTYDKYQMREHKSLLEDLENRLQSLENEKIALIKRQVF